MLDRKLNALCTAAVVIVVLGLISYIQMNNARTQYMAMKNKEAPNPLVELQPKVALKPQEPERHNFRRPNQLIADYDPYVAAKLKELAARKAPSNDSELVQLARDMMDHPYPDKNPKLSMADRATKQSEEIDKILNKMVDGRFIESGAFDGEVSSATVFFERHRNWVGLLVEPDPSYYTIILGRQRNAHSMNGCLSPHPYFTLQQFKFSRVRSRGGQLGQIDSASARGIGFALAQESTEIPCWPVETLLLALNWTRVDFFSLDVEGMELPILKTIPWEKYDIKTLSVEYIHGSKGGCVDYMKQQGYNMTTEINSSDGVFEVFINDLVFVKNKLK